MGARVEYSGGDQTGTGTGLSLENYIDSDYKDGIQTIGLYLTAGFLAPGAVSMMAGSGIFSIEASMLNFTADFVAQSGFNLIEGNDIFENYNVISGVSSTIFQKCIYIEFCR